MARKKFDNYAFLNKRLLIKKMTQRKMLDKGYGPGSFEDHMVYYLQEEIKFIQRLINEHLEIEKMNKTMYVYGKGKNLK